jgi:hypothetical protein
VARGVELSLAAQDAELVVLRVGEHHPAGAVRVAEVLQLPRPEVEQPGQLDVAVLGARTQVEVDPVLDRLVLGNLDEQQVMAAVARGDAALHVPGLVRVVGILDVVEHLRPPGGQCVGVAAVDRGV